MLQIAPYAFDRTHLRGVGGPELQGDATALSLEVFAHESGAVHLATRAVSSREIARVEGRRPTVHRPVNTGLRFSANAAAASAKSAEFCRIDW
jgi:hypothetical protein